MTVYELNSLLEGVKKSLNVNTPFMKYRVYAEHLLKDNGLEQKIDPASFMYGYLLGNNPVLRQKIQIYDKKTWREDDYSKQ